MRLDHPKVRADLKLRKDMAKPENYSAFGVRAQLGRVLGQVLPFLDVTHRREPADPEALAWTAVVEAKNLQSVLYHSGHYAITMNI